eukprot:gene26123-47336_t
MRYVEAVHASVIVGVLPLATAAVGALLHRQRPSAGFWICAAIGSSLVVGFALLRSGSAGLALHPADALLLAAMGCAAVGYGYGARLSQRMRAEHVICWALLMSLPLSLPGAWLSWPTQAVGLVPWLALGYASVFSMWLGFFAWYRGLALGGTVRVSQVQLLQPFMSLLVAVPLLGERLDGLTLAFAAAVVGTVIWGRNVPMKASLAQALARLPGAPTATYPEGLPFATQMSGGSMSLEIYAPGSNADGQDRQTPHAQDELYFVQRGRSELVIQGQRFA